MNNITDLETSILGFLRDQPVHGYDLHKEITNLSGVGIVWKVKMGKLYAMLHNLEDKGLIQFKVTKDGKRPLRNEYSITEEGKATFDQWRISPVERGRDFRIIFLLKMFFTLHVGNAYTEKLISNQINTCQDWLKNMNREEKEIEEGRHFNVMVKNFRKSQISGYISWLEWCKSYIAEEK